MKKSAKCEPKLISGRELARRLGVSETAVRNAVKSGRIFPVLTDAKGRWFNEDDARAQWGRNTLPEKPTGRQVVKDVPSSAQPTTTELPPLSATMTANEARVARETAQARLLGIRIREIEGSLVDAHKIRAAWEKHVTIAKQLFLALPMDLRMHIPSLTLDDVGLIEKRIHDILNELALLKIEDIINDDRA